MAAVTLVGAVAVWTAGGRGHWFLRTSVLVALVALSLLVFPEQAMLGLAIEAATVVVGLCGFRVSANRSWTRREGAPRSLNEPDRFQFSLRDLLLATVVVAMAAGLISRIPAHACADAKWITLYGAWFGVLTLVAVSMVYGQRRSNEGKPPWLPPRNTVRTVCIGGLAGFVIAVALDSIHRAWSAVTAATIANLSLVALAVGLVGFRMINQLMGGEFADLTDGVVRCGMRCQARMRILICELAVRVYAIEQGGKPETLAALVPDYLDELPVDPFTREPLKYRRGENGYQVYSVGPDKKDDVLLEDLL